MKGEDANAKRLFVIFALLKSRRLSLAVALDFDSGCHSTAEDRSRGLPFRLHFQIMKISSALDYRIGEGGRTAEEETASRWPGDISPVGPRLHWFC